MDNKKFKIIALILAIITIGLIGYKVLNQFGKENIIEKNKQTYKLEKFAESGIQFNNSNSKIIGKNGIFFLTTQPDNYIKIYNKKGENITPKEIDNKKITNLEKIEKNNDFLGYIVTIDNQTYYINETGEIILNLKTTNANALERYINIKSDKICKKNNSNYDDEYCSMIYDLKGNLLIDGNKDKYYSPRVIYDKNEITLFVISKNEKIGIIDKENNIIINFEDEYIQFDYIENRNIIIAKKNESLIDVYNLKGNLLKNINLNEIEKKENKGQYTTTIAEYSIYLNDAIYLLDENYNLKEYKDIYNINEGKCGINLEYDCVTYYITDQIYIKDNNGIYTIHNLKGEKIINEEFKIVSPSNRKGKWTLGVPNEYIALCKNIDFTNCGAIDYKGNILLNFENEINNYKLNENGNFSDFEGFKNNNQYFDIINGKVTKKINCLNNQMKSNIRISQYNKNTIEVNDENATFDDGGSKIIDYNCKDLSEAKYYNINEYENFIIAQNNDWITYDVYNINGELINSKNIDKNKLKYFLGYSDKKLYFNYENEIYILKEKNN